ncbi:MAG: ABC transporter substrate-binding protein [Candidatus Omnitrophica bacterium]|nr:ABC transporter substrate-binding protein [Candidatus Omnitrophota bacterium]
MLERIGNFFIVIIFILALTVATAPLQAANEKGDINDGSCTGWGWPLPYEQVSKKSLEWLESKGWSPLTIGYFADIPGYSACYSIIKEKQLLEKRGLSVRFVSFLSGPPIVEAFLGGQTQVTHYGDFPFWLTVDKGALVKAYALTGVNMEVAMLVHPDSSIKKPEDLKQEGRLTVVGATLGSYAEFYLTAMAEQKNLVRDKDFRVAGLTTRDAQLLPKGVDAVCIWDPHITFSEEKGLGKKIDTGYAYFFNTGFDFVRREIHENAPDVVQALADAAVEALLYAGYDIDGTVDFFRKDPRVSAYSKELIRDQIAKYVTFYPPTFRYIHKNFWATEDSRIIKALNAQGRVKKPWSIEEMEEVMAPEYMANTFQRLGWEIPKEPVFLPLEWNGKVSEPPYPGYIVSESRPRNKE